MNMPSFQHVTSPLRLFQGDDCLVQGWDLQTTQNVYLLPHHTALYLQPHNGVTNPAAYKRAFMR